MSAPEELPLKTQDESEGKPRNKSFKEKLGYIKENVTLEPVLVCYVIPVVLSRLATQNLNLDKACRVNLGYGDKVCDALLARDGDLYKNEEKQVQELIASIEGWKNLLLTIIPSLIILFLGAWSDRTGKRKLCILLPIIGDFLTCISNTVNALLFYQLPVEVAVFFDAFFPAITGGWVTMFMGTFSYMSDISSEESRTFRVGIANFCLTVGSPIGSAISGVLLKQTGYYGVYTISSLCYLFSIIYGYVYILDIEKPSLQNIEQAEKQSVWTKLRIFFDLKCVTETMTVAFRKGPNNRRIKSILVLVSIAFIWGPAYGEESTRYLFTRYRFNWDALKYSFYNTFFIVIHVVGSLISIALFSRRWQWDDSVLGLISSSSHLVGVLCTAFARNTFQMYFAVAIEMFNATSFTALRSISSKLVPTEELGKMTSFFNLMEVLTSMVFGPMYSWVYVATLDFDPSFVYYLSAVLTMVPIFIFIWFYRQRSRKSSDIFCN